MSICECEGPIKVKTRVSHTCCTCNQPVKGLQLKKKLKYMAIIGVVGYGVGQVTENVIFDNRYPLEVEYSILDACVNSSGSPLSLKQYRSKQKVCLCAVGETINTVNYSSYKSSSHEFNQVLLRNLNRC
ncbi:hypothetical protein ACI1G1_003415 [Vibrio cholerae]|uniref:hypothetical protein n=1 Tax=Vibrio TaxID=662 RepID=UPI001114BC65|nr:hypothetical protein [Vibrio paracholerae]EGQ9892969.1 hypothetical protein [Vibrio cholerae]EIJ2221181.1 hypothetical protein [Vibrio cholerae]EJL6633932.1 hypothetical protein [Vibrio cholerae]EJL6998366.1 hypothetical protein [Vibrio cholerae]EJO4004750.1 hypothetical protein [Vibrio cholerae]